jgi:hypothetical protein
LNSQILQARGVTLAGDQFGKGGHVGCWPILLQKSGMKDVLAVPTIF